MGGVSGGPREIYANVRVSGRARWGGGVGDAPGAGRSQNRWGRARALEGGWVSCVLHRVYVQAKRARTLSGEDARERGDEGELVHHGMQRREKAGVRGRKGRIQGARTGIRDLYTPACSLVLFIAGPRQHQTEHGGRAGKGRGNFKRWQVAVEIVGQVSA